MKLMAITEQILKYRQGISFSIGIIFAVILLCEFTSKSDMLKLFRSLSFLALILGFSVSGISINLKALIQQSEKNNCEYLIKDNTSHNNTIPTPFFELIDEKEIDEDEQIKHNPSFLAQIHSNLFSVLVRICEKQFSLPFLYQQNYAFQAPRIILFHSWKYFHS